MGGIMDDEAQQLLLNLIQKEESLPLMGIHVDMLRELMARVAVDVGKSVEELGSAIRRAVDPLTLEVEAVDMSYDAGRDTIHSERMNYMDIEDAIRTIEAARQILEGEVKACVSIEFETSTGKNFRVVVFAKEIRSNIPAPNFKPDGFFTFGSSGFWSCKFVWDFLLALSQMTGEHIGVFAKEKAQELDAWSSKSLLG